MNAKTIIQLLIFLLIVIFIYFFIKNTFLKDQQNIVDLDQNEKDEAFEEIKAEKDKEEAAKEALLLKKGFYVVSSMENPPAGGTKFVSKREDHA